MGIVHLMGVGNSPGVVTAAIAYMEHNKEELFRFSSSPTGRVEALVVAGTDSALNQQVSVHWNNYGRANKNEQHFSSVVQCIRQFVTKEYPSFCKDSEFYFLRLVLDDPWENLRRLAKACAYIAYGQTGKELWVNLTGGHNVIQTSMSLFCQLCGEASRVYYTFVPYNLDGIGTEITRFLQPVGESESEFRWIDIPILPTAVDKKWQSILEELRKAGYSITADELLGRLKQSHEEFRAMDVRTLKQQYLLKMRGQFVTYNKETDRNGLAPAGKRLLELFEDELLFYMLTAEPKDRREIIRDVRPQTAEEAGLIRLEW